MRVAYGGRASAARRDPIQLGVGVSALMRLFMTCSASLFSSCVLHRPGVGLRFALAGPTVFCSGVGKLRVAGYGRRALSSR
jgi:hypothetical protein